jgi:hypothetical protein
VVRATNDNQTALAHKNENNANFKPLLHLVEEQEAK